MKLVMGIFKGKVSAQKVFDTVANGVDKLAFTNEERSDLNLKIADKVAEFANNSLSENTLRSKTRRFVSIAIVGVYLLLSLVLVGLSFTEHNTELLSTLLFDSPLSTAFIMVLAFFFGGYYLKGISLKQK